MQVITHQHSKKTIAILLYLSQQNSSYTDNAAAINNPAYQDKASERRRTVGSDNPHKLDDKPSSVHRYKVIHIEFEVSC